MSKTCSKCKEEKELTEFYKKKGNKDGWSGQCRPCRRIWEKEWKVKNRDRLLADRRKWYAENMNEERREAKRQSRARNYKKLKNKIFDHYGRECACCGEDNIKFLSIDHINSDGGEHRERLRSGGHAHRQNSGDKVYRDIVKHWPDDIQILCYNCNMGKQHNDGVCPHKPTYEDYKEAAELLNSAEIVEGELKVWPDDFWDPYKTKGQ